MSALPIRLRLTLAFTLTMAIALIALGFFFYSRVGDALVGSVDQSLRGQVAESVPRLAHERELVDPDARAGSTVAQLLDARGTVVRATPRGLLPLLGRDDVARVRAGATVLVSSRLPGLSHEWRLLAVRVRVNGRSWAFVVARSLESREEALHRLFRELVISGPLALLVAALAGYGLAAAALRPVEAMRRRAAGISASTPGQRLPAPRSRDEMSRLAETLNEMLGRLEAAFARERRFVADASHELRTPLALLRTELELALRRKRTPAELEQALRAAAEDTDRLGRLAEDLLLLARADQNGLPIRHEELAVDEILDRVQRRFSGRAAERARTIERVGSTGAVVQADPDRLEQALGNLVDNALQHGRGTVSLSVRVHDDAIELHVEDEGGGLPQHFLPRAFDRFSRPDDGRSGGGSGLGLAIVDLVARAHGGTAHATSRDAGGADIWISIPRTT